MLLILYYYSKKLDLLKLNAIYGILLSSKKVFLLSWSWSFSVLVSKFTTPKKEKDTKHERSKASKRLRDDMVKGNVRSGQRIYIEFATETYHAHHLMGEVR